MNLMFTKTDESVTQENNADCMYIEDGAKEESKSKLKLPT